jgi:hypothetical protein
MIHPKPNKCFITDLETFDFNKKSGKGFNCIIYNIKLKGIEKTFKFSPYPSSWATAESTSENEIEEIITNAIKPIKHILCGLIYNDKIQVDEDVLINTEFLKNVFRNTIILKQKGKF